MLFKSKIHFKKSYTFRQSRGFGLVELMVSISIMTLVSTVILVKNRSFNNALLLRNQAYEVAFSLRQAQLLAVSGNKESASNSNQYGIYFDIGSEPGNGQYRLFRDDSNSGSNLGRYDSADHTLPGGIGTLDNRFVIREIVDSNDNPLEDTLSVTFVRPNFDALFKDSSGGYFSGPVYLKVSPKDDSGYTNVPFRLVEITSTGQISVK
ncbi:prepilin-type N-terminal cleavage/methylation domain-containing protein [Patescibacteria group bacterium]|nr:prepilin-type N-terminal cleavage/methylation domain-containing protein [Patescibacteria group bacterium]